VLLVMACYAGFLLALTLHLQEALRFTPLRAGLTFAAYAGGFAVASLTWTRAGTAARNRLPIAGPLLMGAALLGVGLVAARGGLAGRGDDAAPVHRRRRPRLRLQPAGQPADDAGARRSGLRPQRPDPHRDAGRHHQRRRHLPGRVPEPCCGRIAARPARDDRRARGGTPDDRDLRPVRTGGKPMASIRKETLVDARPDDVWDALRDWGALHKRLVRGFAVDCRLDGADRIVTFFNGAVMRERLIDCDDHERRLAWSIVDGPHAHHNGSAQVFDAGDGRSRFVWITELLPDDLRAGTEELMETRAHPPSSPPFTRPAPG
jgi:drug/metabolite transporter superfamily protein YnfA